MKHSLAPLALALALCGCQVDDGSSSPPTGSVVSVTPTPTSITSPAPSPTPAPAPTPSSTPTPPPPTATLDDGVTIIVAEGDSITAPTTPKYYAGAFAAAHPDIQFKNIAVGGSMLKQLVERREAALALRPDILTVFIGANGFGPDAATYAALVLEYVAPFRALGTKVYVGTVLPRNIAGDPMTPELRNAERRKYAEIMQLEVGKGIDGIIDFGRAPIVGDDGAPLNRQIYVDGLHPTTRDYNGGIGGHDYLFDVYEKALTSALKSIQG